MGTSASPEPVLMLLGTASAFTLSIYRGLVTQKKKKTNFVREKLQIVKMYISKTKQATAKPTTESEYFIPYSSHSANKITFTWNLHTHDIGTLLEKPQAVRPCLSKLPLIEQKRCIQSTGVMQA